MKLTLRAKGIIAFVALVAYVALVGFSLAHERQKLLRLALDLEQIYLKEHALDKVGYTVAHAILRMQDMLYLAKLQPSSIEDAALDVELVQSSLEALRQYDPRMDAEIGHLERGLSTLRLTPSLSGLLGLRDSAQRLDLQVNAVAREAGAQRKALWEAYYRVYDTITMMAVTMNLLGAIAFGAVISLFFNRMAWDIRKLEARALNIVAGYRGAALDITRSDEVGGLMQAVNRMQLDLSQREQQLEIMREQQFYREKMAAIGSLAAAVAHEINNPIAAIAGIAQSMCETSKSRAPGAGLESAGPESILQHTRRIAAISRQIAELTAPHSPEPGLLDLNGLVRQTCGFVGYDERLRGVDVALDLDAGLPAIHAVADHLTQVLLNLLINAADALVGVDARKPVIRVATRAAESEVIMTVGDNGHGMDAAVLAQAFEEFFTTKPPNKGRGLGLFLCKALLEGSGGRIELQSTPGTGTTATVRLPVQPGVA